MATFTGQAATNNTFAGTAAADTFQWAAADLSDLDTATGGGGADVLRLTTAGVLAANALTGISGIPTIYLATGTNNVRLVNGNLTGVAGGRITVFAGSGNDTIDASLLTGTNALVTLSGGGVDVLTGGAGADLFLFAAADLDGDTITGGAGADRLQLNTAGVLGSTALAAMTGVENIVLAAGTNTVRLANGNLTGVAGGRITVSGSSGNDTIDASSLTGTNAVVTLSGGGVDVLTGGAGADTFRFLAADMNGDTINGGLGSDRLELTTAGTITAAALANMSGVEAIYLATGINSIALGDANLTGVAGGRITVFAGSGNDTIDGSALTGTNAVVTLSGGGVDVLTGGAGADLFLFAAADLDGDTITGGAGADRLQLNTAGVLGATALAAMTGVENIVLAAGTNTVRLVNGNLTGVARGRVNVSGSSGNDTIDASSLTGTNAVLTLSGGGVDVLTGGAGADTFRFLAADLNGDTINGGLGSDRLELTTAGTITAAALANMSGVEEIYLATGTNSIALGDANLTGVAGERITVFAGSSNDTIDLSGLVGTNAAVTLVVNAGQSSLDLSSLTLIGWNSNDQVVVSGTSNNDNITGTDQNDVIGGNSGGSDTLSGGRGDDVIGYDFFLSDSLDGGNGNDTVRLDSIRANITPEAVIVDLSAETITELSVGKFPFRLDAKNFENADFSLSVIGTKLIGTNGDNTLIGGSSADRIIGGRGADTLTGGGGADSFMWNYKAEGGDTITDFVRGSDKLSFATLQFGFTSASFNTAIVVDSLSFNQDMSSADLILTNSTLTNAAQVQNFVQNLTFAPSGPVFLIGRGTDFNATLYYVEANLGAGGVAHEVADLGPVSATQFTLDDFVFI